MNSLTAERIHQVTRARSVRPRHKGPPAAQSQLGSGPGLPDIRGQAHPTRGPSTGASFCVNADIYVHVQQRGTGAVGSGEASGWKPLVAAAWAMGTRWGWTHQCRTSGRRTAPRPSADGVSVPPPVPRPRTRPPHKESTTTCPLSMRPGEGVDEPRQENKGRCQAG